MNSNKVKAYFDVEKGVSLRKDLNYKTIAKLRKDFIAEAAKKDHTYCYFSHEKKWYDGADLILNGHAHFYQKMVEIVKTEGKNIRFLVRPTTYGSFRLSHFKLLPSEYSNN